MKKKLLVFSHAGVLHVNRALFQALAHVAQVDLLMVIPRRWQGDLIEDLDFKQHPSDANIQTLPLNAYFSGNGSLFFYPTLFSPMGVFFSEEQTNLLKNFNPDIVFVDEEPWSLNAFQIHSFFEGKKILFFTKQNISKKIPWLFRQIEEWNFNKSSQAYAISEESKEVLSLKGYRKPVKILRHSYDPELFKIAHKAQQVEKRKELNIPIDSIVISYFGRLVEEKGVLDLINAQKKIAQVLGSRSIFFLWVGNGPLYDHIKTELSTPPLSGRATLIEAIPHDQVGQTLSCSDILVLPSRTRMNWKEQFGRILVEAMACGLAVIGSNSGEIPNLIKRSGGGLIFQEGDVNDLCDQILRLINTPSALDQHRRTGAQFVHEHLTHEAVARLLAQDLGLELRN